MRVACLSDTHMRHRMIAVPDADLLIHAGDLTRRGGLDEFEDFIAWFAQQPAPHKVLIAGNHDLCCEREPESIRARARELGVHYLQDEAVRIEGVQVYGSPVTPTFRNMAFNRDPGAQIRAHWDRIPEGTEILVTHGPPRSVLDRMALGRNVGCVELLERVRQVRPLLHVFGHIHEARGQGRFPGLATRFVNAANARLLPIGQRGATVVELPLPTADAAK